MRPRNLAFSVTVTVLLALATSPLLAAQEERAMHHRYKLIDMGTFGGPASVIYGLTGPLNNRGVATSCADTSNLDSNYPNINPFFGPDPYVQHAFRWQKGRLAGSRHPPWRYEQLFPVGQRQGFDRWRIHKRAN